MEENQEFEEMGMFYRKKEDSLLRELVESCPGKLDTNENAEPPWVWDKDLNFIGHKILEEMRCSEANTDTLEHALTDLDMS